MTILYVALACITVGAFIGWTLHVIAVDMAARRALHLDDRTFRRFTDGNHPPVSTANVDFDWNFPPPVTERR